MILMDKTKETVTFEFEGKVHQMTREEIVGLFFQKQDCNIAENQTWEDVIADVIQRMKLQ